MAHTELTTRLKSRLALLSKQLAEAEEIKKTDTAAHNDRIKDLKEEIRDTVAALEQAGEYAPE